MINLTEKQWQGFTIISIHDRLDSQNAEKIELRLLNLLKISSQGLIIDLKNLTYLSSSGMRLFIKLTKEAKKLNRTLCFVEISNTAKETLEMAGFLTFMTIYNDINAAIDAMKEQYIRSI